MRLAARHSAFGSWRALNTAWFVRFQALNLLLTHPVEALGDCGPGIGQLPDGAVARRRLLPDPLGIGEF